MTTVTLWLLIFTASGYRPAVVVEHFNTQARCEAAAAEMDRLSSARGGPSAQLPACLRVEAVR